MTTHTAPPVVYPLGRSRSQAWALSGLWIACWVSAAVWFYTTGKFDGRGFFAAVAILLAGAAAGWGWKNAPVGRLAWDGQLWRWESSGYQTGTAGAKLVVIADFQQLLLLRIENQAHASLWLWAEQNALPERWLDLRRAVFSSQKASGGARRQNPGLEGQTRYLAMSGDVQAADSSRQKP